MADPLGRNQISMNMTSSDVRMLLDLELDPEHGYTAGSTWTRSRNVSISDSTPQNLSECCILGSSRVRVVRYRAVPEAHRQDPDRRTSQKLGLAKCTREIAESKQLKKIFDRLNPD